MGAPQPLVARVHEIGEEPGEDEAVVTELVEGSGRGPARDTDHVVGPVCRVVAACVARSSPVEVALDDGGVEGEPVDDDRDHAPHEVGEDLGLGVGVGVRGKGLEIRG